MEEFYILLSFQQAWYILPRAQAFFKGHKKRREKPFWNLCNYAIKFCNTCFFLLIFFIKKKKNRWGVRIDYVPRLVLALDGLVSRPIWRVMIWFVKTTERKELEHWGRGRGVVDYFKRLACTKIQFCDEKFFFAWNFVELF